MSGSRSGAGMGVPNDRQPYAAVQSESGETPTPGLVLWDIGRVIATCLGLAVMVNLALAAPGMR